MDTAHVEQRFTSTRGLFELWAGFLLGPIAWAKHLAVSYFLAGVACDSRWNLWLLFTSVTFLAMTAVGAWLAWRSYNVTGREWPRGDADGVLIRSRFLAVGGLILSALSALLIVAQTIPMLVLPPCA